MSGAIKRRLTRICVIVIDIGRTSWSMTMHYLPRITSNRCELRRNVNTVLRPFLTSLSSFCRKLIYEETSAAKTDVPLITSTHASTH